MKICAKWYAPSLLNSQYSIIKPKPDQLSLI